MPRLLNLETLSLATQSKIRKAVGVRTTKKLIQLAIEQGVQPSRRSDVTLKRAFNYFGQIENDRIADEQQKLEDARRERAAEKRRAAKAAGELLVESANGKITRYNLRTTKGKIQEKIIDKIGNFEKIMCATSGNTTREDLYASILAVANKNGKTSPIITRYVSVIYEDKRGRARIVSLKTYALGSFERFSAALEAVEQASEIGGSDRGEIDLDEYKLLLNNFFVNFYDLRMNGDSDNIIFPCAEIKGKGFCVKAALKHIGVDIVNKRGIELSELMEFVKDLPIKLIPNAVTVLKMPEKFEGSVLYKRQMYNTSELTDYEAVGTVWDVTDMSEEKRNQLRVLIVDDFNSHVDVLKEPKFTFFQRTYLGSIRTYAKLVTPPLTAQISSSGDLFKGDKLILSPTAVVKNSHPFRQTSKTTSVNLFFDFETVIDFDRSSCMAPYSLSIFMDYDGVSSTGISILDSNNDVERVSEVRRNQCKTFVGYDCGEQFIAWLEANQHDKIFTLIGFNNSNFDNLLLLEALLNSKRDINISNIFIAGNSILDFKLNGRHTTFDLRRHLVGSLAENCKSFKVKCCAKKSFDHAIAQAHHDNGTLIEWVNASEELKEYNEYDVLATAVVYYRYEAALAAINATKLYPLKDARTIGSLIYKVFSDSLKKKGINLPALEPEVYQKLLKNRVAGRVEMFNGIQKIEDRVASPDVCSLYAYISAVHDCYYPCGEIVELDGNAYDKNRIGFYDCVIDQSKLRAKNLPLIFPKKTTEENDWAFEGLIEATISNVMVELLLEHGCKVNIRKGFVFTDKRKSCDMFDFILDIMSAKNVEDGYKSSKDPEEIKKYNPALRETMKLLMNALTGKVTEGLHVEKTVAVENSIQYCKIADKAVSMNAINAIGGKIFVSYTANEKDLMAQQRPIYLGALIYDYAKAYMYRHSYAKIGLDKLLYTDTDATKMRYADFERWQEYACKTIVPHWPEVELVDARYKTHTLYNPNSKVFGSFEEELEEYVGEKYTFYCLQKKSWLYVCDAETKFRFKGINPSSILLDEKFTENDPRKIYKLYQAGTPIRANPVPFFERLYSQKTADVLCSSFRRVMKNAKRNVGMDELDRHNKLMSTVQVNILVKTVKIVDKVHD